MAMFCFGSEYYSMGGVPIYPTPSEEELTDRALDRLEAEYSRLMTEYEGHLETGNLKPAESLRLYLNELEALLSDYYAAQ